MKHSILAWLATWRKQQSCKRPIRPLRPPLTLEHLESRLAPAVITVNSPLDAGAANTVLTFRQAIELTDGTLIKGNLTAAQQALITGDPVKDVSNTINFAIADTNETINIQKTVLPTITKQTIINATPPAKFPNQTIRRC